MRYKACTECGKERGLWYFHKAKNGDRYGRSAKCKECVKEYSRKHYDNNKERWHEYYSNNREKILEREAKRYLKNRNEILERQKHKYKNNINGYKDKSDEYYEKNKKEMFKRNTKYCIKRKKRDPAFKLRHLVSNQILRSLKKERGSKCGHSCWDFLPYTKEELVKHIENQFDENMSWNNHGSYWELDHIYPQSKIPYDSMSHPNFLKCWNLNNLRPLEAKENHKKNNKIINEVT